MRGQIRSVRKMGTEMLMTAWKIVSQTAQIQFTSTQRPYHPRDPRSIQFGSKNDFTARPSSIIPYAAPRRRAATGFNHLIGGVEPDSISAITGDRRTSAQRGRRFG